MPLPSNILVVAHSARMLAQMARSIGLLPVVIDCFGDVDTRRYALAYYLVPSLAQTDLRPVVEQVANAHQVEHVIYGGGFEYFPESLVFLAQRFMMLGNSPATFYQLQDKLAFFKLLDRWRILHPAVRFTPPHHARGQWLIKPFRGQGGVGVKRYCPAAFDHAKANESVYWQQYQQGTLHSVLFLAAMDAVRIIGFNTQWSINLSADQAFLFSGIINAAALSIAQQTLLSAWVRILAAEFGLQGLNSLDFIKAGEHCFVLEINPRPSASLQLYAPTWLSKHLQVCAGTPISGEDAVQLPPVSGYQGYQVLFAPRPLTIPGAWAWPKWCQDLPPARTNIATTEPICSIIASSCRKQKVKAALRLRQQRLLNKLT